MNTEKNSSAAIRWGLAVLGVVALVAIGLAEDRLAPSRAGAPDRQVVVGPQGAQRGFIGLPNVNTISVQNTLTTATNITVTFVLSDGTTENTIVDTLPPESMRIYADPGGDSNQGYIEAVANVSDFGDRLLVFGTNFELSEKGNDAYLGLEWADETFLSQFDPYDNRLPLVTKNHAGWTTAFTVQNPPPYDAANVVLSFYDQAVSWSHHEAATIDVGGSRLFNLADMPYIPEGFIGSVVVCSDQPVSVTSVRMYHTALGLRGAYPGIFRYEADTTLMAPALFKASDMQTSELCVQNVGDVSSKVEVAYTDGVTNTVTLDLHASHCFDQSAEAHVPGWSGGALITGDSELAGVVSVTAYSGDTPVGRWMYSVPPLDQVASGAVALPLLFNDSLSWTSTVHLFNWGDSQAVVVPRYVSFSHPEGFVHCAQPITIPAESAVSIPQSELPPFIDIATGYFTATQPVAAVVSVASDKPIGDTDRHFGYGAGYPETQIDPQKPCDKVREVFVPIVLK